MGLGCCFVVAATNTPNFQADLDETQPVADKILVKQEELHLKCGLSSKHLEITTGPRVDL